MREILFGKDVNFSSFLEPFCFCTKKSNTNENKSIMYWNIKLYASNYNVKKSLDFYDFYYLSIGKNLPKENTLQSGQHKTGDFWVTKSEKQPTGSDRKSSLFSLPQTGHKLPFIEPLPECGQTLYTVTCFQVNVLNQRRNFKIKPFYV